jgi:hypothetical protein
MYVKKTSGRSSRSAALAALLLALARCVAAPAPDVFVIGLEPLEGGVSDERFTVPPLGEATASIVTSTTLIDLMRQVYGAQSRTSLDYRLEGKLYLDSPPGRSLSFETEGTLEPPGAAGAPPR